MRKAMRKAIRGILNFLYKSKFNIVELFLICLFTVCVYENKSIKNLIAIIVLLGIDGVIRYNLDLMD